LLHEASGSRGGRVDVLAEPAKRRSYTTEQKARLVASSYRPGVTVTDVARQAGVHPQLLFSWRREAREGRLALPEDALPMFAEAAEVPSVVAPSDGKGRGETAARAPSAESAANGGEVVIELGEVRLRIGPDVAPERAAALVATLRDLP
jgi:transposase